MPAFPALLGAALRVGSALGSMLGNELGSILGSELGNELGSILGTPLGADETLGAVVLLDLRRRPRPPRSWFCARWRRLQSSNS